MSVESAELGVTSVICPYASKEDVRKRMLGIPTDYGRRTKHSCRLAVESKKPGDVFVKRLKRVNAKPRVRHG